MGEPHPGLALADAPTPDLGYVWMALRWEPDPREHGRRYSQRARPVESGFLAAIHGVDVAKVSLWKEPTFKTKPEAVDFWARWMRTDEWREHGTDVVLVDQRTGREVLRRELRRSVHG